MRTLAEVFRRSLDLAETLGLRLPVVACGVNSRAFPDKVTRVPCPWRDPGRFDPAVGLIQGTKVAITGPTTVPRTELARRLSDAGLDVMNSVSGKTGIVIANPGSPDSRKLQRARLDGIPVLDEGTMLRLADHILPGTLKSAPETIEVVTVIHPPSSPPTRQPARRSGPWASRRVLILGGSHLEATVMRSRIVQLGAVPAINLTAAVTDVLLLDGGDGDPRMPRIRAFELDTADRVLTDDEFVFYNQPASPDGAVRLTIDGSCEQGISIDLRQVPPDVARIAVGAAIESQTFGDLGALSVSVDTEEAGIATAVLDAATTERSMIIAEIYRRGDVWRLRMIGQGYDDDLGAFAVRYGVEVDD